MNLVAERRAGFPPTPAPMPAGKQIETPRSIPCPECRQTFRRFEELGPHIERHRPGFVSPTEAAAGKRWLFCPRGCGRSFPPNRYRFSSLNVTRDFKDHIRLCDGSLPLIDLMTLEDFMEKIDSCPEHRIPFNSRRQRGQHMRYHHPDWRDDSAPEPQSQGDLSPSGKQEAKAWLVAEARRLRDQANDLLKKAGLYERISSFLENT